MNNGETAARKIATALRSLYSGVSGRTARRRAGRKMRRRWKNESCLFRSDRNSKKDFEACDGRCDGERRVAMGREEERAVRVLSLRRIVALAMVRRRVGCHLVTMRHGSLRVRSRAGQSARAQCHRDDLQQKREQSKVRSRPAHSRCHMRLPPPVMKPIGHAGSSYPPPRLIGCQRGGKAENAAFWTQIKNNSKLIARPMQRRRAKSTAPDRGQVRTIVMAVPGPDPGIVPIGAS